MLYIVNIPCSALNDSGTEILVERKKNKCNTLIQVVIWPNKCMHVYFLLCVRSTSFLTEKIGDSYMPKLTAENFPFIR